MRRIDVIAAHRLDLAQTSLDAEVVLEDTCISLADFQERGHGVIWNVVPEVAGGNWGGEPAQL